MTHITKLFSSLFIIVLSLTMVTFPIASADAKGNPKYASIVIDADTGAILSQRYADKKLHPASLTKVMTLMLTFDAIKAGKVSLYDRVVISPYAASMVPSKLGLKPGETIRVKDAIYILVTKSANDIAVALAEHLGGTEY
ncbi:MAG: serine hydrolase, partial [Pseudomonadota bacterium]|nr:serine hydrolase [Pseudomonadota bacterium]